MGVVNVTPDSFSDGGRYLDPDAAVAHGARLLEEGADVLDVGGESTRPGAEPVDPAEEARRVVPVVERLAALGAPVSVDTRHAEVARAALQAGACVVNDVSGFRDAAMAETVAASEAGCVVMHMRGDPRTMQQDLAYADVVAEVRAYLVERAKALEAAGVAADRVLLDPGLGFGKSAAQNAELLRATPALRSSGHGVLVGASRKGFLGLALDEGSGPPPPAERVEASVAAAVLAAAWGADVVRVHDVRATVRALRAADRIVGRVPFG